VCYAQVDFVFTKEWYVMRCVVIGAGSSGARFLRAVRVLTSANVQVVGVAERDCAKREALRDCGVRLESDYRKLLLEVCCDLIVIATNDSMHFEILEFIYSNKIRFQKILCEKPLVTAPSHRDFVRLSYLDGQLAVSFVERYSLAVQQLMVFLSLQRRRVARVSFEWSKNRIKDVRPTVGAVSEITHPLDLACYIGGVSSHEKFDVRSSFFAESDFVRGEVTRPDTIQACIEFESGMLLTGVSSYLRSTRSRCMEFLLVDDRGVARELAVLKLDNPCWDNDSLEILKVMPCQEQSESLLMFNSPVNPDPQRQSIEKICKFLEDVVRDVEVGGSPTLVGTSHALYIQSIVACLEANHSKQRRSFVRFLEPSNYNSEWASASLLRTGNLLRGFQNSGGYDDRCD
jgi:predicted dehydrogenase